MPYANLETRREHHRKYMRRWLAVKRANLMRTGLCIDCAKPKDVATQRCAPCNAKFNAYSQEHKRVLRLPREGA